MLQGRAWTFHPDITAAHTHLQLHISKSAAEERGGGGKRSEAAFSNHNAT